MAEITTVFLDRDGVINKKRPEDDYVKHWGEFEFLQGALEAISLLTQAGVPVFIVTNQRGVARGKITPANLEDVHQRMLKQINEAGGRIDFIYICPHDYGQCDCRKPLPGLYLQAAADYPEMDLHHSVVIGDALSDMDPGSRLGCHTVLIADGERRKKIETEAASSGIRIDYTAPSLLEAVEQYVLPLVNGN